MLRNVAETCDFRRNANFLFDHLHYNARIIINQNFKSTIQFQTKKRKEKKTKTESEKKNSYVLVQCREQAFTIDRIAYYTHTTPLY